jgi:hypothetical protein
MPSATAKIKIGEGVQATSVDLIALQQSNHRSVLQIITMLLVSPER